MPGAVRIRYRIVSGPNVSDHLARSSAGIKPTGGSSPGARKEVGKATGAIAGALRRG